MSRPLFVLFAFALISPGCVPVTEPVGDIDKAEPAKDLIGAWKFDDKRVWVVDRAEVKGHPKGLMRIRVVEEGQKPEETPANNAMWFFTTTIGKHTYANLLRDKKKGYFESS